MRKKWMIAAMGVHLLTSLWILSSFERLSSLSIGIPGWSAQFRAIFGLSCALALVAPLLRIRAGLSFGLIAISFFARFIALTPERSMALVVPCLVVTAIESVWFLDSPASFPPIAATAAALFAGAAPLRAFKQDIPGWSSPEVEAALLLFMILVASLLSLKALIAEKERLGRDLIHAAKTVLKLTDANVAFQEYAKIVEERGSEQERKRITREIHDSVGYSLTNILMMAQEGELIAARCSPEILELQARIKSQALEGLAETRKTLRLLRNDRKPRLPLLREIENMIQSFSRVAGIEGRVANSNMPDYISEKASMAVYRMIQECLTNTLKHSNAKHISISCWLWDEELVVEITDDGEPTGPPRQGIGFSGMQERLEELGGKLLARPSAIGFQVIGTIPRSAL